jgi:pyruvate dehydrogenase E2 component (dihydrolipoamide acetyltransferase)
VTLTDGRVLNALVAGPGGSPKIVFIHGLGGSQSTWQVLLGELVERYRVTAIDLPGHGASDKSAPDTADYSLEGLTGAVAEAIVALKAGPAVIAGHSLGGAVTMQLALEHPELVTGLVLINSAGLGREISNELLDLMAGEPGSATARGLLQLFFEDQALVLDRGVEEMAGTQTAEGAWAAQQAVAEAAFDRSGQRLDLLDRHGQIAQPVAVVWGAKDRVIPVDHAYTAVATFSDVTLRVFPELGHVPQVENAAAVAVVIDRFTKSLA